MPALLKWGLVLIVPDAILDGHLPIILGSFLDSILDSFFGPAGETICRYIGVFCVWGSGSDLFLDHFWHMVLPMFPALGNPIMLPAA
jgi:hypothetical protein